MSAITAPAFPRGIRSGQSGDQVAVLAVWRSAIGQGQPRLDPTFIEHEEKRVRDIYLPAAELWVTQTGNSVTGFAALLGHQLGGLFVAPDHQGQGLGQILLDHAIAHKGDLEVDVFEANIPARRFYDRNKFLPADDYIHTATGLRMLRLTRLDQAG